MLSGRALRLRSRNKLFFHVPRHAEPSHDPEYASGMVL